MFRNEYSIDGLSNSSFYKGELIETKVFKKRSFKIDGSRNWATLLGVERIEKGISIKRDSSKERDDFNRTGIAYEFSKLKNENDINFFAQKYGLLGIATPTGDRAFEDFKLKEVFNTSIYFALPHGFSFFEPLQIWEFYIDQIRKILKLYKTLVSIHQGNEEKQIEGNLLNIGAQFDDEDPKYFVEWWDGIQTGTGISPEIAERGNFVEIARQVLIGTVNYQANRSLNNIAVNIIETNKPPLGFHVQESRVTKHLINAIYYDLWDLISKNDPIQICENPNCKLPFKKQKRQKYCSNACKQEAYRIRKAGMEK